LTAISEADFLHEEQQRENESSASRIKDHTHTHTGFENVRHEVSVPSATVMLFSGLLFAGEEVGRILLVKQLSHTLQLH
jgi:hypothetical protein